MTATVTDLFCGAGGSSLGAEVDDNTIRRIIRFSRDAGYGAAVVVNLFALRATDPGELDRHPDPVGPENDTRLAGVAHAARITAIRGDRDPVVVVAWGARAPAARVTAVLDGPLAGLIPHCLGRTKDGHPRHPLYVPAAQQLTHWDRRRAA